MDALRAIKTGLPVFSIDMNALTGNAQNHAVPDFCFYPLHLPACVRE
jgi:hypothetical protein